MARFTPRERIPLAWIVCMLGGTPTLSVRRSVSEGSPDQRHAHLGRATQKLDTQAETTLVPRPASIVCLM